MTRSALVSIGAGRGRCRGLALPLVALVAAVVGTAVPVSAEPWADLPAVWKLAVGDRDEWRAVGFDDRSWRTVELREGWDAQGLHGFDGIVWYRRQVVVDTGPGAGELALFLVAPSFGGFEVYAGGELVGQSPGWRLPLAVPTEEVYPVPAEAIGPDGSLVLALRVRRVAWASDHAPTGRPVSGMALIGDRAALREHAELIHAREHLGALYRIIFAGLFGAVGIFHLLLAVGSREQKTHLWFGLLALLFGVNTLADSVWIYDLTLRLDRAIRWEAASGHLAVAVAIQFLWVLFARPISWPLRGYQLSQVVLGVWALAWPKSEHILATETVRWLWLVPALVLVTVRIVAELRGGGRETRILAAGAVVVVVVEGYEVLLATGGLTAVVGVSLAPFGFAAFLGATTVSLWERFRRTYRELGALKDDLEQRVRERTGDLERAKERAEIANRLKNRFLRNVSHELRTPLTGIMGISELLGAECPDGDRRELVEQLRDSAGRLQDLIDDLLDFARAEADGIEIDRAPVDPRTPVADCLERLGTAIAESGLEVETAVGADVPAAVEGDRQKLRRVLVHLVDNAIKFTERGRVRIALAWRPLDGGEGELVYTVGDTGSGIAREALDRLFVPFHQLDDVPRHRHGGAGLGLAIVRTFVEAWGGRVWAESTVGQGSAFSFTVPVTRRAEPAGGEARTTESPRTVLVAEDDDVTGHLLERFLRRAGHRVDLVRTGHDVLSALDRRRYDVVLMDLQMPGLDGLETSRQIGRRLEPAECPLLVALTASLAPEDRAACKEVGLSELLRKPIDFDALGRLVGGGSAPGPEASGAGGVQALREDALSARARGQAPAQARAQAPVLDPVRVARLGALGESGGEPLVETLLRALVARLERDLPQAALLARQGEWQRLSRLVHSLVGSASNVGASSLAGKLRLVERAVEAEDRTGIEHLVASLPSEVERLRAEVEKLLSP